VTQVCEQAGVELRVVPLTEQYWGRVVSHCLAETRAGRTPNPDMLCNSRRVTPHAVISLLCCACSGWALLERLDFVAGQSSGQHCSERRRCNTK
jgi:hypothetical protein